jgi:hypothetical protein
LIIKGNKKEGDGRGEEGYRQKKSGADHQQIAKACRLHFCLVVPNNNNYDDQLKLKLGNEGRKGDGKGRRVEEYPVEA